MIVEEFNYLFRDADPRQRAYYRMMRDEYRKKHPLANFEKWKEGLTPEKLLDCVLDSGVSRCIPCPARDECVHNKQAGGCNSAFLAWANAPAKEEE